MFPSPFQAQLGHWSEGPGEGYVIGQGKSANFQDQSVYPFQKVMTFNAAYDLTYFSHPDSPLIVKFLPTEFVLM